MSRKGVGGNIQLKNAESSVLFLQQEHAKTLEGLYSEIGKLQKKCGELTFQLAMNSTSITPEEENFQQKCVQMEQELGSRSDELSELKKVLDNKVKHNSLLERSLRRAEENSDDIIREKDKIIASLTAELDSKADNIAFLTTQLHNSKVAYSELHDRLSHMDVSERNFISPAPPREKAPSSGQRRRFVHKADVMDVDMLRNGLNPSSPNMFVNVKTAKSSEGFPSRSNRVKTPTQRNIRNTKSLGDARTAVTTSSRNMPDDYTEFLKTGSKPDPKVVYKPAPNPLPPILNGAEHTGPSPTTYKVHRSRGQNADVVDEILVSPLNSPDKNWRQGSNQYDSVS